MGEIYFLFSGTIYDNKKINLVLDKAKNSPVFKEITDKYGDNTLLLKEGVDFIEGRIQLPIDAFELDIDDFIYSAEHWFDLLSEIRNNSNFNEYIAEIDGVELFWDSSERSYKRPR
ncbi:hypothetical protein ACPUEK_17870 [Marinomonas gallaica]|uniref:hypothetical protein n=1 Tax=Marinomonas gallaica TaxID=1806667 RepID=UPI003CE556CF